MNRQPRTYRILMILENNGFPDDTRVLLEAQALTEAGFHVTVVCPREKGESFADRVGQVQVYRYPAPPEVTGILGYLFEFSYSLIMAFSYAWFVLVRQGFDAIHVHAPPDMNALVPFFFKLFGKRFVYDMHDLSPELFQAQRKGHANRLLLNGLLWFERFACRTADRLIATNETQKRIQTERCHASPDRCYVVRNGPNQAFLDEISPQVGLKKAGKCLIGYVGLIAVQDGVDYLVRAAHFLRVELQRDDFQAVIVGGGPALDDLQRLVQELNLQEHIFFTERIPFDSVPSHIAAFDICVTPDPRNAYNDSCTTIKTMEYMALRKPIVCFETTENIVTAGPAALVAGDNDVRQLAGHIEKLMDDPSLRSRMGNLGRERIERGLTWRHQAEQLVLLYRDLFGITATRAAKSESTPAPAKSPLTAEDGCRFAFSEKLGDVLTKHLRRDMREARLSLKFKLYYYLRAFIPHSFRSLLQQQRNQGMHVAEEWYVPHAFLHDFRNGLRLQLESHPDCQVIHPWPAPYTHAAVMTHDVETAEGFRRIDALAKLEERLGVRSAWFIIPHKYKVDHGLLEDLRQRGHEIGLHGYNHDGRLFTSPKRFMWRAKAINIATGAFHASGFRAPMVHRNLDWMQALQIDYDASCFDVDPFQAMPGGVGGPWPFLYGNFVELPYTIPQDHTLFALGNASVDIWLKKYRMIQDLRGMALLITHPDYMDSQSRLDIYRQYLEHIMQVDDAWKCLPSAVSQWWRARDASRIVDRENSSTITGPAQQHGQVVSLESLLEQFLLEPQAQQDFHPSAGLTP
jgi:glycosyltransferase involved in cell wall biosynthesis/peptidoglycan/xylan/chitin deacetylase (PgdA/CDA1 family)